MRKIAVAAVTVAFVSMPVVALAADLGGHSERYEGSYKDAPSPAAKWDGAYLGAHIGGAWGNVETTDVNGWLAAGQKSDLNTTGVFGGGTLGYNFQRGAFVLGVEGDIGGMDLSGTKVHPGSVNGDTTTRATGGVYGDITGRLGFAADRALFYAKGGVAFMNAGINVHDDCNNVGVCGADSQSNKTGTSTGWTVGGGVEYLVSPNWSVKAEYQHFDFGTEQVAFITRPAVHWDNNLTVDTVKIGVNYHLNSNHEPLK
jgi:outer membrane immunogenic protein